MHWDSDSMQQDVHLSTISDNECITVMSLVPEDSTEPWRSGELYPGQIILPMTLSQPLSAGEYPSTVLRYQHFTLDEEKTAEQCGNIINFESKVRRKII